MGFVDFVAVGMAVAIGAMYFRSGSQDVAYVRSDVDGNEYLVRREADALEAANTMAHLNARVQSLISHLAFKLPEDERVVLIRERYNPAALSEGGHNSGHTSYSVDKGRRIVMCLRSRGEDGKHGPVQSINLLMYVLLHELAHLATEELGHTPAFWENFGFLKREAADLGVYKETDFSSAPQSYCGITIRSGG